ncbi:cytochrome c oxidase assembly factor 7 [Schistosoma bovis]|uniref:Cytochrome c oxidase assembly factor 7 n=2 Tax=Schistosoma TaxID=6181 RepID=A0A430PYD2_SCHBO|nr:cytochrome c oxidase assembly factor 7 [Schistosoma bovis]
MTDSGILSFKTPEEMHEYMKNIGLGFEYSCIRENNPVSCHSWALWFSNYKRLVTNGADILKENCFKRNYGDSCYQYGSLKVVGDKGVLRDSFEAFRAFEHGCKAGKQGKCCQSLMVPVVLINSLPVTQISAFYALFMTQAAGRLVADGIASHAPNLSVAMSLFELGCQNRVPESCFHLGGAAMVLAKENDKSTNSEKSPNPTGSNDSSRLRVEAFKAWMEGCKLGHEFCCRNIAKMYSNGDGVEMDELKAKDFLLKADQLATHNNVTHTSTTNTAVNKTGT